jgi:hypothetical protein
MEYSLKDAAGGLLAEWRGLPTFAEQAEGHTLLLHNDGCYHHIL